ncbi:UNVERIFIED_CONTAM: hypothetical protein Sradi_5874100 [Sesamum radiatum]|uniref:Uncharacterized protein n=1 Tax=Sesamum radiatum TaxID=300843 RepID=A0AAW2KRU0_SESRA
MHDLTPLTLGSGSTRKTCLLKFLVVNTPSAYNVILGRPTLNAFQAVISTYHMKIKFSTVGGVGEVQGDSLQSCKCYVEVVRKARRGAKDAMNYWVDETKEGGGTSPKVQPAEKLLNIELISRDSEKITRIGSQMDGALGKK